MSAKSALSIKDVLRLISDNDVKFVDLPFTDTKGKEQHISIGAATVYQTKGTLQF